MCPDRRHKVGEGLFLFHFHKLRNKDLEKKKSEDIWWGCLSRIKHYRVNSISLLVWQWMEGWNESKDFDWIHWDSLLRNHHHQSMMNVVEKISRVTNIKQRNKITPPLQQETTKRSSNSLPLLVSRYSSACVSYSEYPKIPVVDVLVVHDHPKYKKKRMGQWSIAYTHVRFLFRVFCLSILTSTNILFKASSHQLYIGRRWCNRNRLVNIA